MILIIFFYNLGNMKTELTRIFEIAFFTFTRKLQIYKKKKGKIKKL